jgi:hypothetical protein
LAGEVKPLNVNRTLARGALVLAVACQAPAARHEVHTAAAATVTTDRCAEYAAPLSPLAGTKPPPGYPFELRAAPDVGRGSELCAKLGPPCTSIAFDVNLGSLQRINLSLPATQRDRSVARTQRWALEAVRELRAELGLTVVPQVWSQSPSGALYFAIDPVDGVGQVYFYLETREEMGDSWNGAVELAGVTGLHLEAARLLTELEVGQRLVGRHRCEAVPTGEYDERTLLQDCDPSPGDPDMCSRIPPDYVRVPRMRTELRRIEQPPRFELVPFLHRSPNRLRLVWSGTVLLDAFTGETVVDPDGLSLRPIRTAPP